MSPRTDRKDAKAVLTVIKQLRDETYRVKKGDKDKYSIQRKLQYRGYKLLRDPELLNSGTEDIPSPWVVPSYIGT
jgi:SOS response regulatory protein OraA/RecX